MCVGGFLFLIRLNNVNIVIGVMLKLRKVKVSDTGTINREFVKTSQKLNVLSLVAPCGGVLDLFNL